MATKVTIEDLAAMVKNGFDEIHEKMVTKEYLKNELKKFATKEEMQNGFKLTNQQFNQRFDELEEGKRRQEKENDICRQHRALTDARLKYLEASA